MDFRKIGIGKIADIERAFFVFTFIQRLFLKIELVERLTDAYPFFHATKVIIRTKL